MSSVSLEEPTFRIIVAVRANWMGFCFSTLLRSPGPFSPDYKVERAVEWFWVWEIIEDFCNRLKDYKAHIVFGDEGG